MLQLVIETGFVYWQSELPLTAVALVVLDSCWAVKFWNLTVINRQKSSLFYHSTAVKRFLTFEFSLLYNVNIALVLYRKHICDQNSVWINSTPLKATRKDGHYSGISVSIWKIDFIQELSGILFCTSLLFGTMHHHLHHLDLWVCVVSLFLTNWNLWTHRFHFRFHL